MPASAKRLQDTKKAAVILPQDDLAKLITQLLGFVKGLQRKSDVSFSIRLNGDTGAMAELDKNAASEASLLAAEEAGGVGSTSANEDGVAAAGARRENAGASGSGA
jgi:hypothetical protein